MYSSLSIDLVSLEMLYHKLPDVFRITKRNYHVIIINTLFLCKLVKCSQLKIGAIILDVSQRITPGCLKLNVKIIHAIEGERGFLCVFDLSFPSQNERKVNGTIHKMHVHVDCIDNLLKLLWDIVYDSFYILYDTLALLLYSNTSISITL